MLVSCSNNDISSKNFKLKQGDILFQDLDCGSLCNAIEKVTKGYKGANFSHVGLVVENNKNILCVIEAISKGVSLTPIDTFLNRSFNSKNKPKVVVGRITPKYFNSINSAIAKATKLIGKPYDDIYIMDDSTYYCSELIYEIFSYNNEPIFKLYPMTFKDPETNKTFSAWEEYYKKLQVEIPESKLGINPGSISRSNAIDIVHVYGYPSGWVN
ncbi:MAG: hypothetical protein IMY72_11315 [Bacteroidetes bacterium]|nr:hypothetical protein [Bacteroidota bacterium]